MERIKDYKLLCVISNSWCKAIMTNRDPKKLWVYHKDGNYICEEENPNLERVGRLDLLAKEINTEKEIYNS